MVKPTTEELATLSKLYNERRALRNLKQDLIRKRVQPILEQAQKAREFVNEQFSAAEDKNTREITELKKKIRIRNWKYPRDYEQFFKEPWV